MEVEAYHTLLGSLKVLKEAESRVVGKWRLDEIEAEFCRLYPEDKPAPGADLMEFKAKHEDDEDTKSIESEAPPGVDG